MYADNSANSFAALVARFFLPYPWRLHPFTTNHRSHYAGGAFLEAADSLIKEAICQIALLEKSLQNQPQLGG